MQKETLLKIKVLQALKRLPRTWFLKTQEVARSGTPDILASVNGIFVALELKTEDGVISKLQEYNLKRIEDTGGVSIVLTPDNLEASIQFLENIAKEGLKNEQCSSTKKGSKRDKNKLQNT